MYGNPRDLVLGLTVVTPTGDIVHPGGKTMKNVAGIDLVKMFVGSAGTLGIITEAVLRLFPLPETDKTVCLNFSGAESAFRLVNKILTSVLTPGAIELADSTASRYMPSGSSMKDGEIRMMIQVEGSREIVERHLKEISNLAKAEGASSQDISEGDKAKSAWDSYRGIHAGFYSKYPAGFKGKASVPILKSKEMFTAVKEIGARNQLEIGIQVHAGNGIFSLYVPSGNDNPAKVAGELQEAASRLGGLFIFEMAPLEFRKNSPLKYDSSALNIMRQMKTALDPNNILNPGKLVGGQQ
jgi:glycolate oxidase